MVNEDLNGREYTHVAVTGIDECVLSLGGVNHVYDGFFKVVSRTGDSAFGDQVFFEFKINEMKKTYKSNTKHNCFEVYMPKEKALRILKEMVSNLEKENDNPIDV